jgi:hypothetical protein
MRRPIFGMREKATPTKSSLPKIEMPKLQSSENHSYSKIFGAL